MKDKIRKTLQYGDMVIGSHRKTEFYGKIGTILKTGLGDKRGYIWKSEDMPPKYTHSHFVVHFTDGSERCVTAYHVDKVIMDKNGFFEVVK